MVVVAVLAEAEFVHTHGVAANDVLHEDPDGGEATEAVEEFDFGEGLWEGGVGLWWCLLGNIVRFVLGFLLARWQQSLVFSDIITLSYIAFEQRRKLENFLHVPLHAVLAFSLFHHAQVLGEEGEEATSAATPPIHT